MKTCTLSRHTVGERSPSLELFLRQFLTPTDSVGFSKKMYYVIYNLLDPNDTLKRNAFIISTISTQICDDHLILSDCIFNKNNSTTRPYESGQCLGGHPLYEFNFIANAEKHFWPRKWGSRSRSTMFAVLSFYGEYQHL